MRKTALETVTKYDFNHRFSEEEHLLRSVQHWLFASTSAYFADEKLIYRIQGKIKIRPHYGSVFW